MGKTELALKDLNFINNTEASFIGYYKTYIGYKLYVDKNRKSDNNNNWFAVIVLDNGVEISIPIPVDSFWLLGFDENNK